MWFSPSMAREESRDVIDDREHDSCSISSIHEDVQNIQKVDAATELYRFLKT